MMKYTWKEPNKDEQFARLSYRYNHGGRYSNPRYRTKANHSDCSVRAISLATGIPYWNARKLVEAEVNYCFIDEEGVSEWYIETLMLKLGWEYVSARRPLRKLRRIDKVGLPNHGSYIVSMPAHIFAVVDGFVLDAFDSRREEKYLWWYQDDIEGDMEVVRPFIKSVIRKILPKFLGRPRYRIARIYGYWMMNQNVEL